MDRVTPQEVTQLLVAWGQGETGALEQLMPLVYEKLRSLAHHYMAGERPGHTLQATALVNETYLKLIDSRRIRWQDRVHFFAVSAQLMRRVLVDSARARRAKKRGEGAVAVSLNEEALVSPARELDLIALDEALERLTEVDPRKSRVVEMKCFGGLTVEEMAEELKVSTDTVHRDWRLATFWMAQEMGVERKDGR